MGRCIKGDGGRIKDVGQTLYRVEIVGLYTYYHHDRLISDMPTPVPRTRNTQKSHFKNKLT